MNMPKEHSNMIKALLGLILDYAKPCDTGLRNIGWKSKFVATFTDDEKKTLEQIVEDLNASD